MKITIDMGLAAGGAPALMDLEELLATRLLVQGNSGSGKSHLLRRMLEQSAPYVQQAIVDPEGDFVTLAERFGHVVVDAERSEADLQRIASRIRQHRVSVVLNLEGLDAEGQMRCAAAFLGGLFDADRDYWYPMLVVVDEAQVFAPSAAGDVSDEARKLSLGAMTNLMCRGRKRGLAGVVATQRLAKLAKNVAAEASNFLMGRTFLDIDMARAADLLGMDRRQSEMFRDLERGHFVALGPALSRRPLPMRIGAVQTAERSGSPKLMPMAPRTLENVQDLIFQPAPQDEPPAPRPRPPRPPATADILAQLAQPRQPAAPAETTPEMPKEEREAAMAAILRDILADEDAAFHPVAILYQDFLVRCRIQRLGGDAPDLPAFRRRLAVAKADASFEAEKGEEWRRAVEFSAGLPEDLQSVFLLVARAALENAPCPGDAEVARTIGSRSPARARRIMAYMEEKGFVILRTDFRGNRIAALPDLGWETAPQDGRVTAPATPAAPERDLFAAG